MRCEKLLHSTTWGKCHLDKGEPPLSTGMGEALAA